MLFAIDGYECTITIEKTATGFDSGEFEYILYICPEASWVQLTTGTIAYSGGTKIWVIGTSLDPINLRVVESGTNGATGVDFDTSFAPTAINGLIYDPQ